MKLEEFNKLCDASSSREISNEHIVRHACLNIDTVRRLGSRKLTMDVSEDFYETFKNLFESKGYRVQNNPVNKDGRYTAGVQEGNTIIIW